MVSPHDDLQELGELQEDDASKQDEPDAETIIGDTPDDTVALKSNTRGQSLLGLELRPIIMMSQNRQDAKDRVRGELDYRVNLKAEVEISQVLDRLNRVEDQLDAVLNRRPAPGGPPA